MGTKRDLLSEATNGRLHWDDPGMDDFENGWQEFPRGTRVEVRCGNVWRKGTVIEDFHDTDRGIHVRCDERWHDNLSFFDGHGATVMVYNNTRRGILSHLRRIDEPRRRIRKPKQR